MFRLSSPFAANLYVTWLHPTPPLPPWGRQRSRFPGSESSRFPPNTLNSQLLSGGISSVNRRLEGGIQLCVVKRRKGRGEVRKKQVSLVRTTLKRTWGNRGSRSYKMHRTRFRSKEIWELVFQAWGDQVLEGGGRQRCKGLWKETTQVGIWGEGGHKPGTISRPLHGETPAWRGSERRRRWGSGWPSFPRFSVPEHRRAPRRRVLLQTPRPSRVPRPSPRPPQPRRPSPHRLRSPLSGVAG